MSEKPSIVDLDPGRNKKRYFDLLFRDKNNFRLKLEEMLSEYNPEVIAIFGESAQEMWNDLLQNTDFSLSNFIEVLRINTKDQNGARDYDTAIKSFCTQAEAGLKVLIVEDFMRGGSKIKRLYKELSKIYKIKILVLAIKKNILLSEDLQNDLIYVSNNLDDFRTVDLRDF